MPLTWIDGREVAKKWKENAAQRAQALTEKGVTPHLAVIVAGDNPASQVYVRNKENACRRAARRRSWKARLSRSTRIKAYTGFWCSFRCRRGWMRRACWR